MLIPYAIETLEQEKPTANRIIIGACIIVFLGEIPGVLPQSLFDALVLRDFHPTSLVGHMFLHAGFLHLIGNMLFLWVFGNAVCANVGNIAYPLLYLAVGIGAALVHLLFDGRPAIGASGAINGITGIVVAMYPLNRVHLLLIVPPGITRGHNLLEVHAWVIILAWLAFDHFWLIVSESGIVYWAHMGGFIAGVATGLLCLRLGWLQVTEYDNKTLLDLIRGPQPSHTSSLGRQVRSDRRMQHG
jgi:membrane associated rhomboid family serine protease